MRFAHKHKACLSLKAFNGAIIFSYKRERHKSINHIDGKEPDSFTIENKSMKPQIESLSFLPQHRQ